MVGYSMPSHEVYHQSRAAHGIGLPNDDATLDQLVLHYERMDLIDFPPRLHGTIITNDRRALAFTRWYNDPSRHRINIPAYTGMPVQPQYYHFFSPSEVTEALANPMSGLRGSLLAFTQKIKAESQDRWSRPTVTSIGWNQTMGMVAFGSTNKLWPSPDKDLRGQQREDRNPWKDEEFFRALQRKHAEIVATKGAHVAGHPPGNCAEWNIPNALSMPGTVVHLLSIKGATEQPVPMCPYCEGMVKEICRRNNITVLEYTGPLEPARVFRWLPNGVWSAGRA
ncbi:hypothetical protein FA95DRAFT_1597664 [Auriscalpium vulgare]|uniref:Uncharacterized protein n=1 Tax=Auriscalpium vulgare TaxID=40419 RepID=A0ACB8RK42_9AGAM|nr:hypothetical protein FA95DRAFT_1597664 [Auriscalpium vulgare]